jgi:hypothetical protein
MNFFDENYFSIQQVKATSNDCEVGLGFRVLLTVQSLHLLNHWRCRTDVRSKCTHPNSYKTVDFWVLRQFLVLNSACWGYLWLTSSAKQLYPLEREREREIPSAVEPLETWLITEWRLLGWLFHHLMTRIQLRVHILFAETC